MSYKTLKKELSKLANDNNVCLGDDWWLSMKELFEQCRFLDGKICGKVKE